jgi:hypothetical protein
MHITNETTNKILSTNKKQSSTFRLTTNRILSGIEHKRT